MSIISAYYVFLSAKLNNRNVNHETVTALN